MNQCEAIEMLSDEKTVPPNSDTVWGAANIGRTLNCSARKAFYLLEKGLIPGRKIGGSWVSTASQLRAATAGDKFTDSKTQIVA